MRDRGQSLRSVWGVLLLLWVFALPAWAGQRYAVASAHPLATQAGEAVLAEGGNAFDAAVAVAAALAVVEPFASGLGGGGFFLLHRGSDGQDVMVDAREMAPGAASRDMYLDAKGDANARASLDGALAGGIPGLPAGLVHLASRYGTRPLTVLLAPAVRLARDGFAVDGRFASAAGVREAVLRQDPVASTTFLNDGKVPEKGFVVRQPALAATLEALARGGFDGFYRGPVAAEMVRVIRTGGGAWTEDDLARYRVVERPPVRLAYRGARITTATLPSSSGLVLAQALQILERYDLDALPETERTHLVVEAMRRAFQDRGRYLGDADFVDVPQERLRSRAYADRRAASISLDRATPSASLEAAAELQEGDDTTHFSVVDAAGNRVAATLSINGPFGAGLVLGGTGVMLNNEMNDFAISMQGGNLYGLTGFAANAIAPGKRPLSSMAPTFVEDARGVLVLGTPGGARILSMVLLGILEHVHRPAVDLAQVVGRPRFHHQFLPDRIEVEPGQFSPEWMAALKSKGHTVQEGRRRWGNMQAVFVDAISGEATAAGDPRGKSGVLF
ncbi:MAG: gamma-glutamyltransferase [Burkholderiales bacterium]